MELVLATDLAIHFKFVGEFKTTMLGDEAPTDTNVWGSAAHSTLRKCLIKQADISHASKERRLHFAWSERIQQEFFVQVRHLPA